MSKGVSTPSLTRRRGAGVYLAGSLVGQACALLRYTVLARLLGPEQLGLVATLTLVSNFFEMISDTGSDRFLVQDREGDNPEVQKLVQLVVVARGAFMAIGLALVAWPVAHHFDQPPLLIGLAVLGFAPLIAGFMHLDVRRFQRSNDFRAEGVGMIASELLALIATLVAALVVRDFTAILYGLIVRSVVLVAASHITAERRYELGLSPKHAARLSVFAAPLIANGVLLFFASQSDRLLVSGLVGLEALGYYSAVLLLVLYPSVALSRFMQGIHLPLVAKDPSNLSQGAAADLLGGRCLLLSLAMAAGFAAVGPMAILILYGPKFSQPIFIVALVGVLQGARFLRVWTVTLAIGVGRSGIVMANSLARLSGIPAAILGFVTIGGVGGVAAGFVAGELIALATGVLLLNRARSSPWTQDLDRVLAFVAGSAIVLALAWSIQEALIPTGLAAGGLGVGLVIWLLRREKATMQHSLGLVTRLLGLGR